MSVDRRDVLAGLAVAIIPLGATARAADRVSPPVTLEASPGKLRLKGDTDTAVWAYNASVPGPLLRVKKGDELQVRLVNKLDQPTSLCWHGVRIVNAMDGVAGLTQKTVMPGESFDYRFTPPDSGTFWYHPHAWPSTAEQIGRGLYGVLIVDESVPPAVDDDLLMVLDDWALDEQGQIKGDFLAAAQANGDGRIGALVTVGSKPIPETKVLRPGARVRLRLLNACSARLAVISFVGMKVTIIAIDGQPSEIFEPAQATIPIGPGSRFDLMLDVPAEGSPAGGLPADHAPVEQAAAPSIVLRGDGTPDQPLMAIKTEGTPLPSRGAIVKLPANPLLPTRIPLEKSLKRDLVISQMPAVSHTSPAAQPAPGASPSAAKIADRTGPAAPSLYWALDGQASDGFSGKPLFTVKRGSAVTLTFVNRTGFVQQMHVHGHVFRRLHDLDDGWDPYWRESVLLAPGKTKHLAFIADNPGRWAVESLILDRQVTGLAGFFIVEG